MKASEASEACARNRVTTNEYQSVGWCWRVGQNGVRSLAVHCNLCHHEAVLEVEAWPDHVPVPAFRGRVVCTRCGIIGGDVRPNWRERPERKTLTGTQWQ
jgi:hypothetical protein